MLKQGTFINKKFYRMLIFNLLSWGAYAANSMIDAVLGGNQLGEIALSAVSIVAPLGSFISFLSYIFYYRMWNPIACWKERKTNNI